MDSEKIGAFIKRLRNEHNMSQNDLAEKIPIGRNAISKWECGRTIPDSATILILSDIFKVSTDEIMYGEYKTKDNETKVTDIHLQIYDERNAIKKKLKTRSKVLLSSILLLIIALFSFLTYYFLNSYDSVKIYTIVSEEMKNNDIEISDGIIVLTGENIYFRLGIIKGVKEEDISKVKVYYKDNDNEKLIYEDSSAKDGLIRDYYDYNEYFEIKNKGILFDSLFVDISIGKDIKTIKLSIKEDYSNKRLFFKKHKKTPLETAQPFHIENQDMIKRIKEKFDLNNEGDIYHYSIKKDKTTYDLYYSDDTYALTIIWKEKKDYFSIEYSFVHNKFFYEKSDKNLNSLDNCSFQESDETSSCDPSVIGTFSFLMNEIQGRS